MSSSEPPQKKPAMSSLDNLKKSTTVVADTGDFKAMQKYKPTDATTNPTLILKAANSNKFQPLLNEAVLFAKETEKDLQKQVGAAVDKLLILFGVEILKIVPGRVSLEVDPRLSFDKEKTIEKAKWLIKLCEESGISKQRVLIKIAATWEGIEAAKVLQKLGCQCNLTLVMSLVQAVACAEAEVTLISPFVGRILDWYSEKEKKTYAAHTDPGVVSVTQIYNYFKKFDFKTLIMGASFRNIGEIKELSGCDLLTISPALLEELENSQDPVPRKLSVEAAKSANIEKIKINEPSFRWMLNENQMATEKLSDGIRKFAMDYQALENLVLKHLQ